MPEILVHCGPGADHAKGDHTLTLDVAACQGSADRVNLRIAQITRSMLSDIPDRLVDLLEIAAYVYAADQLVSRGGLTMRGNGAEWRRHFRIRIPVREWDFWKKTGVRSGLERTLGFLSDDTFEFAFVRATHPEPAQSYLDLDSADGPPKDFNPARILLFSSGLDSLSGALSALSQGERLALVSHRASPMVSSRQTDLVQALKARYPGQIFHVGVTVTKGLSEAHDFNQRTRSFLFATLAFVIGQMFRKAEITFCENGLVSVNLPIARHIIGSRATRTTHPKVLADLAAVFSAVAGQPVRVLNPLFWKTKTEVVSTLAERGGSDLIRMSFSCSNVRFATKTARHCGTCTQCLERRFAVLAAGLDPYEPEDQYDTHLWTGARGPQEITVAESFVLTAMRFANSTAPAFFARYGEVFRVLPYLEGDRYENAQKIHELHRRHGIAVMNVVDRALGSTSLRDRLNLPAKSLLSLIQGSYGSPSPIRDVVELEPNIHDQANTLKEPKPIERPIQLSIAREAEEIIIAGQLVVTGASFRFLEILVRQYQADLAGDVRKDQFAFLGHHKLSGRLKISEQTLRQTVKRLRDNLRKQALDRLDSVLADDDILENAPWQGYRLNPNVVLVPFPPLGATNCADVTEVTPVVTTLGQRG